MSTYLPKWRSLKEEMNRFVLDSWTEETGTEELPVKEDLRKMFIFAN